VIEILFGVIFARQVFGSANPSYDPRPMCDVCWQHGDQVMQIP